MSGWAGYDTLRPGRIHLLCPGCKRKMSNVPRQPLDPPKAEMCHVHCERCSAGSKDCGMSYLDAGGRYICSYCVRRSCAASGREPSEPYS